MSANLLTPDYVPPVGFPPHTCPACWPAQDWWDGIHRALAAEGQVGPAYLFKPELVGVVAYVPEEQQWVGQMEARWFYASPSFVAGQWVFWKIDSGELQPRDRHACDLPMLNSMTLQCSQCREYEAVEVRLTHSQLPSMPHIRAEAVRKGWTFAGDSWEGSCPRHAVVAQAVAA